MNHQIKLAIIDYQHFNVLITLQLFEALKEKYAFQLQIPQYFDQGMPKKKAIGHCVHIFQDLKKIQIEGNKKYLYELLDWIGIQKSIGIDKIKLYLISDESKLAQKTIQAKFSNYVELENYPVSFRELCKRQIDIYIYICPK